ncbi:MAG: cellulose-binding protein [Chloroflexi bacterium AL-W]|nr:cellulose-binding protein [Chloroflexi bacterium AL-W]
MQHPHILLMKRLILMAFVVLIMCVLIGPQSTHSATQLCGKYDSVDVKSSGKTRFIVQNNIWGASTSQCMAVTGSSFKSTSANHNKSTSGPPASYPSIYKGCHWAKCTDQSINPDFPTKVSQIQSVPSSWSVKTPNTSGDAWNVAYDIWFNKSSYTSGQPNGAELMIWLKSDGGVQPAGTRVGTVSIAGATWEVWYEHIGWNYIAYRRTTPTNSINANLMPFINDARSRGYISNDWYLTAAEAGFEIWKKGAGLESTSFDVSIKRN